MEQTDLIINYLPQNLTDDEFKSMFLSIGPLQSCKIIRDHATNYSYGFGFVDYKDPDHAKKAIETLNGLELQNKRIKVAYSRKGDGVKGTNLYIRGLPPHYKEEDLAQIFGSFGRIVNCRVLVDQNTNQGRGVGFVLYSTRAEAESAIKSLNGKLPDGGQRPLNVQFAEEYTCKARQAGFVSSGGGGNIPIRGSYRPGSSTGGYKNSYNSQGAYGYDPAVYNNAPQASYGSCYSSRYRPQGGGVSHGAVGGASNMYYNHHHHHHHHQPPQTRLPTNEYVLFVYNIGAHSDEGSLWELFEPYGIVTKVAVIMDQKTGQNKGYGFVTMANYNQAQAAINGLNGYRYMGKPLQVSFKT